MRLRSTRKHWNQFAADDPFWAILAQSDKRGRRWSVEEFFRTGQKAIAAEMHNHVTPGGSRV